MCIFILLSSKYYLISPVIFFSMLLLLSKPYVLQHARLACLPLSLRAGSNLCPFSRWCHPTNSSSVSPFSSCPPSLPASGSFLMSWLCIIWPKYWSFSFSISPSNEYSELISFRIKWFDLPVVQGTLQSLLQHYNWKASILAWLILNHVA